MIVDTIPVDSKRDAFASSMSASTSLPSSSTFIQPQPTISVTGQYSNDLDDAPPPYELVTPSSPSQPEPTSPISRKSMRKSVEAPQPWTAEIDTIAPGEAPCICPTNPAEHVAPSFLRPVPKPSDSVSYEPLPRPFVIDAKPGAVELSKSFAPWDIPALHKHDVQKEDWQQLLGDVQACAKLSSGQRIVSGALPVTRHLGPPGHIASFLVEQGMKKQKTTDVAAILDLWNQRFFHPRRLEIILCRGDKRKSGNERDIEFLAPDRMSGFSGAQSSGSSMSSRNCRREHCGRRRSCRGQDDEEKTYRLVVVSI